VDLLDPAALAKRKAVFGAAYAHDVQDVDHPNLSVQTRYVISGDWKLLTPNKSKPDGAGIELFNLDTDPHEETNHAENQPGKVAQLAALLDAWWPGPAEN